MKKGIIMAGICLSVLLAIVASVLYMGELQKSNKYKTQIQNEYSRALSEFDSRLNSISILLEKTVYVASSNKMCSFACELYSEAELAKSALSSLPVNAHSFETLNRFLSQVGNYALSVSKDNIEGNQITDTQKEQLSLLSATAKNISEAISDSQIKYNNIEHWIEVLETKADEVIADTALADSLTEIEENLSDYPTLLYDGPYSDHILKKEPLMISNAVAVSEDAALDIARDFLPNGVKPLKYNGEESGKIEAYRFSNNDYTVSVSKSGGYIVYMRKNEKITAMQYSYETAIEKAKEFLEENGYNNMTDTYYFTTDGICTINFAYLDGQTVCYTDLIKVGVSLSSGEIVFFESAGYLTNHRPRAFESPTYTQEQAREVLDEKLDVKEWKMALIPTDGAAEIRCYEFLCEGENDREILIYVSIKNLTVEQIFILLNTDGGTMVK
ncbi:MAG: germination protein YpeB [Clostridia bacterium]|nr:germination protein YpeB [Clostridia bacterium]